MRAKAPCERSNERPGTKGPRSVTVTITVTAAPGNDDPNNQIGNAQPRDLVTVNVAVPFDKVSYLPGSYLNGKNLSAQSAMRHE